MPFEMMCHHCRTNSRQTHIAVYNTNNEREVHAVCNSCIENFYRVNYRNCTYCGSFHSGPVGRCHICAPLFRCNSCNAEVSARHLLRTVYANNRHMAVCASCLEDYVICGDCNCYYSPNYVNDGICYLCVEERERDNGYDEDEYHESSRDDKVRSTSFQINPFKRYVGFELEFMHKGNLTGLHDYGHIHDDGSIRLESGYNPAEFSSYPSNGDSLIHFIRESTRIINKADSKVNTSCGFHVHLDMAEASHAERNNVKEWWKVFERVFFSFVSESRRGNTYTKQVTSMRGTSWERDRYCSLNLTAFSKWSTYEIRLHHGTTNCEKVTDWIMFLLRFFDTFSAIPYSEYRRRKVKRMTERELLIFLFQQMKIPLSIKKKFVRRVKEYGQYISFSKVKKEVDASKITGTEAIYDAFLEPISTPEQATFRVMFQPITPEHFYSFNPDDLRLDPNPTWTVINGATLTNEEENQ